MIICKASSAEATAIAQIHRKARQKAMPWLPILHTPEQELWFFSTVVLPIENVLIAREETRPVGFISSHQGWLNHLYIAPDRWGLGLGTRLLAAARSDSDHFQLWVFQENMKARQFYYKHGFREREFTNGRGNEERVPDVRMEWSREN
jgi:putative acetyltransferase